MNGGKKLSTKVNAEEIKKAAELKKQQIAEEIAKGKEEKLNSNSTIKSSGN